MTWSSDGTVTDISVCDNVDFQEGVEFHNGILLPDLVNAHCHLELSYMAGMLPQGEGFAGFARGMGERRNAVPMTERLRAAADADRALWRQGVGFAGDVCNGASTFGIKSDSTVRYTSFLELFGLGTASVHALDALIRRADESNLRFTVTPHSTYSLNDAAFRSAAEWGDFRQQGQQGRQQTRQQEARQKIPLSIHFMESPAECELFGGGGELARWYAERGTAIDFEHYGSPARRIVACIPPQRRILLVHNVCVTEEEIDIIQNHFGAHASWVLCPRSNEYISRMQPPVALLRRKGVRIAVGTDSLASNTSLDMVAELRMLQRGGVPLEEALAWVTVDGTDALGIDRGAQLEVGNRCGAVLLTGVNWNDMSLTDHSQFRRIL